ncbi:hypothetical protein CBR_g4416 [Chara braunii]|uniref:Dynein heavy chain hydrolytic ATP-binding dynein motor region domain-containing protein n=1 Tax=Chara braunii TaxID=69332 RepID=A0A388KHP0_CHABU|nr:hypothetical protein CBR_g4416 [Chara braunii]|eukprot:GBG69584.1 hypothetical protein CBR_g4416 [Chara braunii]
MRSSEGEQLDFLAKIGTADEPLERWLAETEAEMQRTMREKLRTLIEQLIQTEGLLVPFLPAASGGEADSAKEGGLTMDPPGIVKLKVQEAEGGAKARDASGKEMNQRDDKESMNTKSEGQMKQMPAQLQYTRPNQAILVASQVLFSHRVESILGCFKKVSAHSDDDGAYGDWEWFSLGFRGGGLGSGSSRFENLKANHPQNLAVIMENTKTGLQKLGDMMNDQLMKVTDLVRKNVSSEEMEGWRSMAILGIHLRDTIRRLVVDMPQGVDDFRWRRCIRYYREAVHGNCTVEIADAGRMYGYEYVGNRSRLVITGLTERCFLGLLTAFQMSLGGAVCGPPGSGKTETFKDLAKSIGKACVVFNCSDSLDFTSFSNVLKVGGLLLWSYCLPVPILMACALNFRPATIPFVGKKRKRT